jgi:hypothetical protein
MSSTVEAPPTATRPGSISPLAGKPAPKKLLTDVARLEALFYECRPDPKDPNHFQAILQEAEEMVSRALES